MSAQDDFDRKYITSSEIGKTLKIPRCTIFAARERGLLPEPIRVNGSQLFIWERETVKDIIDKWQTRLISSRSGDAIV